MRTKNLLASATVATVAAAIDTARERGWTTVLISKHGNDVVRAHLGEAPSTGPALVVDAPKRKRAPKAQAEQPVAQQLARVEYKAPKLKLVGAKPKAKAKRPAFKEQSRVGITLTRDGEQGAGMLIVGQTRKKLLGEGTTTDARIEYGAYTQPLTLSRKSIESLLDKGANVWVAGHRYIATLARA